MLVSYDVLKNLQEKVEYLPSLTKQLCEEKIASFTGSKEKTHNWNEGVKSMGNVWTDIKAGIKIMFLRLRNLTILWSTALIILIVLGITIALIANGDPFNVAELHLDKMPNLPSRFEI